MRSVRLMRELREINHCPVANVSVCPLDESNLSEWHGNIRGPSHSPSQSTEEDDNENEIEDENEWKDIVVHFSITFPLDYPIRPPRVRLFSFVPHLNVQHKNGFGWELCLDMLELQPIGALTTPYRYWSSAFSVRSILVQMTSFLLTSDHPTQTSTGNIERTKTETREFTCSACNHSHSNSSPPFPTFQAVMNAPLSFPCVEVSGDSVELLQSRMFQRKIQLHQEFIENQKKTIAAEIEKEKERVESIKTSSISTQSPTESDIRKDDHDMEKQNQNESKWNVVGDKFAKKHPPSNSTHNLEKKNFIRKNTNKTKGHTSS